MLDKNMLVGDGWRPYKRGSIGRQAIPLVRVSKAGGRLILSRPLYDALGQPPLVNVLWDPARVRVALEPATADDADSLAVQRQGESASHAITFGRLSAALGLVVDRVTTVPHQLDGFRLIIDLRGLRARGAGE